MITLFNLPTGVKTSRINQSEECHNLLSLWWSSSLGENILDHPKSVLSIRFASFLCSPSTGAPPRLMEISNSEYLIIVMAAGLWLPIWFYHSVLDEILWWFSFERLIENNQRNFVIECMGSYWHNYLILLKKFTWCIISTLLYFVDYFYSFLWKDGGRTQNKIFWGMFLYNKKSVGPKTTLTLKHRHILRVKYDRICICGWTISLPLWSLIY